MAFGNKDKKKLALYDQLLDELVQIAENPELKAKAVELFGQHRVNSITDFIDAINEVDE